MQYIAIFASGTGSNAQRIIQYFKGHESIRVGLVVSNKADAYVLTIAKRSGIPHTVLNREEFFKNTIIFSIFDKFKIDWVILAGFLWKIPKYLIETYHNRIINIHPALLPAYGGKGMYGMNVHQAVWENKERETGISIHYVNENYDEGKIIFQAACSLVTNDTPQHIARKVQALEHQYFPQIIEREISERGLSDT